VVDEAKDLKPRNVRLFRCTRRAPRRGRWVAGKAASNVTDRARVRGEPRRL